ncbi:hypothetical protein H5410_056461 [Solanum commersonii]|uniref:Uncharacterized protein n=1 Tax=Solanum commersonii TaxID=4109 RepID=A0A9J5WM83_SOLCO|nr:hypothetical protein H5410_056461 [Solanum commersonii]
MDNIDNYDENQIMNMIEDAASTEGSSYDGRLRKISAKKTSKIWITKRSIDYSTRKLAKRGVYPLRGSFDLENGLRVNRSGVRLTLKMGWFVYRDQPAL